MAGAQNQANPQEPYGHQGQAQKQWSPPPPRRPGSTSTKVWGILLLIFGGLGLIFLALNLSIILGGGVKASTFSFNMSPEAKAEMDRVVEVVARDALGRWTFWVNVVGEVVVALISLVAGFFLVMRPRVLGRKLAIARALAVLLLIPVYGYESMASVSQQIERTATMQEIQIEDALKQEKARNPGMSDEELDRQRQEIKGALEQFQPVMEVAGYAGTAITVIGILVINGVLLFFMTRPNVKDYLESVAADGEDAIPGYDPSMGLMSGAPPPSGPPHPGQPTRGDEPPNPPERQIPPV